MLQYIGQKVSGIIAWTIIALIAVVFAAWGMNGIFSFKGSAFAAKVNGEKISWQQVEDVYRNMLHQYAQQEDADITKLDTKQLKKQARQQLVNETAAINGILKEGFIVSPQAIASYIVHQVPQFQENNQFSKEKYELFLAQNGMTTASFQQMIEKQLLFQQFETGVTASAFTIQPEVENFINLIHQKRDIGYTIIPVSRFLQKVEISENEAREFYQRNKELYVSPEKIKISYVELSLDQVIKNIQADEDDLLTYYKSHAGLYESPELVNVRHILIEAKTDSEALKSGEARAKADDLLAQLKLDGNFEQLAKKHSDDSQTASNGGELGWVGKDELPKSFEHAAFNLREPSELSEVVQTEYGFHVIQLIERKEPILKPFEEVREQVAHQFKRERAELEFSDKGEELANLAFENSDSLQPAADALDLNIKTSDYFTRDGGDGLTAQSTVINAAFDEEQLINQRNSDILKVGDDKYIVLRVSEHQPPYQQSFKEAEANIREYLTNRQARDKAEELGNRIITQLKENSAPNQITRENNLRWQRVDDLNRSDTHIDSAIIQQAFQLPRPQANQANPVVGFSLINGNFVVLSLANVKQGDLEESSVMEAVYQQQLESMFGALELSLYQDFLLEKADIELTEL